MKELDFCPFCGGKVEMDDSEMFTCLGCGLIARFPSSPKQIKNAANGLLINNYDTEWHVEHWNTRAELTCKGCNVSSKLWCIDCARNYPDFYSKKAVK